MFDKIKDLGTQAASKTTDAIDGITTSVKHGVESIAHTATAVTDSLNERAVRASASQMYRILEIALEELKDRPLAERPLSLTSSVNIGIASLELQIQLNQPESGSENNNQATDLSAKLVST